MTNTHTVIAARLPEAIASLEKLAKKARKYGHEDITWSVSEIYEQVTEVPVAYFKTRKLSVKYVDITLTGLQEAPVVGNYKFIAKIDIHKDGNIINKIPSEDLPEKYRHVKGECEHCKHNRPRKNVYIVQNEQGEYFQIGSTCLRDFMGTDTPESVIRRFGFLEEARELSDTFGGKWNNEVHTEELLAVAHAAIRLWGWTPKSTHDENATPTVQIVSKWFFCHPSDKHGKEIVEKLTAALCENDWEVAKTVRQWCADNTETSDYFHNLRMLLARDVIEDNYRGYAVSAISAYLRAMNKEAQKKNTVPSVSEYIGNVGEKLSPVSVVCELARSTSSAWGDGILYKFRDTRGNVFSWFASASKEINVGDLLMITGSIKAHKEYKGAKETQLTRVKKV